MTEPLAQPLSQAELRIDKIRRYSAEKIAAVLAETQGQPEIVQLLAIGEACPYAGVGGPRAIWFEEVTRAMAKGQE